MTHAHINGVCIRPEEAATCSSIFKTNTGMPATLSDGYNDPDFGFDKTAALSDPGFEKCCKHCEGHLPPADQHMVSCPDCLTEAALSDPGPEQPAPCGNSVCDVCAPTEINVDIRSSGPAPEFLAEQKRWYHSGEAGFDDTKREDLRGTTSSNGPVSTLPKFGYHDICNHDVGFCVVRNREKYENDKAELEVDDIADLDKTDFEDGYNRAYKIDCEDVEYYYAHVSQFEEDLARRFNECEDLLLRKHLDYGPDSITRAPGGPLNGLRVRMHDKLARINHLIDSDCLPENESLRDSFVDLANYAVIALMVLDEKWPEA